MVYPDRCFLLVDLSFRTLNIDGDAFFSLWNHPIGWVIVRSNDKTAD